MAVFRGTIYASANLEIERQTVPESFILLCEVVGKQQPVHNAEQQLLGFRCGQQGAPVFHYAA